IVLEGGDVAVGILFGKCLPVRREGQARDGEGGQGRAGLLVVLVIDEELAVAILVEAGQHLAARAEDLGGGAALGVDGGDLFVVGIVDEFGRDAGRGGAGDVAGLVIGGGVGCAERRLHDNRAAQAVHGGELGVVVGIDALDGISGG